MKLQLARHRGLWFVILLVVMALIWPGYRWWRQQRLQQLAIDCREARDDLDWERLDEFAAEWTRLDESTGSPWLFRAEAAEGIGDDEQTAAFLGKVPDDDPRCIDALEARTELLFQQLNRPLDAVATCERIIRIEPRTFVARRRLIYFYALTLQRHELVRQIRESLQIGFEPPESYVYLFTASELKFSNGYQTNRRWLEHHPDYEPFVVALAAALRNESDAHELSALEVSGADKELTMAECVSRFPQNIELLIYQLDKSTEAGDVKSVGKLLASAPEDANQDSRFWRSKAWLGSMRGDYQESRAALDKSIELDPFDWQSRHELSVVLRRLRMTDEASLMAAVAQTGKLLTREMLELPDAEAVTRSLLAKMATYADKCGDKLVANAIRRRIE